MLDLLACNLGLRRCCRCVVLVNRCIKLSVLDVRCVPVSVGAEDSSEVLGWCTTVTELGDTTVGLEPIVVFNLLGLVRIPRSRVVAVGDFAQVEVDANLRPRRLEERCQQVNVVTVVGGQINLESF